MLLFKKKIFSIILCFLAGFFTELCADVVLDVNAKDIKKWTRKNIGSRVNGNFCELTKRKSAQNYGRIDSPLIKADVNKYPYLTICIDHDQNIKSGWSLVLNNKTPLAESQFTTRKGIVVYDLRKKTSWKKGKNSFSLSLYVIGKNKKVKVKWIKLADSPQKDSFKLTGKANKRGFVLFPERPFKVLDNNRVPSSTELGRKMQAKGCPGEFEPATFMIYADRNLKVATLSVNSLVGPGKNIIPSKNIDIRIVKVWYQGGRGPQFSETVKVPELLLKDDNLLYADTVQKKNILNFKGIPKDGPDLKAFSIKKGQSKQVWLTIKIPENSPSGKYFGKVKVKTASGYSANIPLEVEVLPFKLADSGKILGIYSWSPKVYLYADSGTDMLRKELESFKRHGLNVSSIMYFDPEFKVKSDGSYSINTDSLKKQIDLRMKTGVNKLIVIGFATHKYNFMKRLWGPLKASPTAEDKQKITFIVKTIGEWAKKNNYPEIYYYGVDEPSKEQRERCKELFTVIQEAGGKTFTAAFSHAAEYLGHTLDLANCIEPVANKAFMTNGKIPRYQKKILQYWHPLENPLYERMRVGVITWYGRLNGSFPYAYRHVYQGNPYHDESQGPARKSNERNSMYTYPAVNSIIPTVQWEGLREGIDDLKYLATLKKIVKKFDSLPKNHRPVKILAKAKKILEQAPAGFKKYEPFAMGEILTPEDFSNFREKIIKTILELNQILNKRSI